VTFLEKKKKAIGDAAFACEWELKPVSDTGSPIKEEWIQMWDSGDRENFPNYWWARCPIVVFFDPAYTDNKESDYTAIVATAMDNRDPRVIPNFYCLKATRGKWTDHEEILEHVREMYWSLRQAISNMEVYVENAVKAEASAFIATNRLMNEKRRDSMTLRDWDVRADGRTKRSRISKSAHFYREGRMYFDIQDPTQQILIDELVLFGDEPHDDLADSITGCLNVFRVREKLYQARLDRIVQRQNQWVRDPETGVLRRREMVA
jgi:phage terminase large subunit-like protein